MKTTMKTSAKTTNMNTLEGASDLIRSLVAEGRSASEVRKLAVARFPKLGRKSEAPFLTKRIAVARKLVAHATHAQN